MSTAPQIKNVEYDSLQPVMDRNQIDMLLMVDNSDQSTALAQELFTLYETESSEKLSELETICRERDYLKLRNLVHFIAGSAGNLGLARLSAFYRGIERAIYAERFDDFEAAEKFVREEFELSCEFFRGEFGINVK